MITRSPKEVHERFGPLFCRRFLVMVDETAQLAEIIEECCARGPIEWDAMNRLRARGATLSCTVEGTAMRLVAALGHQPVQFGAAGAQIGGQALEGVEVDGDEVITSWAGMAGAGVGIAACLPQAPGVIRTYYSSEEDLAVGGARVSRSHIVTPRYEKVTIGIDDTDTREEGATWVTVLKCANECRVEGAEFLNMRLVQLNPDAPQKTTNCVASALNFAVRPSSVQALIDYVCDYVLRASVSPDTGIAVFRGIRFPAGTPAVERVKNALMTVAEAEEAARVSGVTFCDPNGRKGRIGALGAVLWANRGIEAAGLYGETA